MRMKKQTIYRSHMIILCILFIFAVTIDFQNFHYAYHSMGIVAGLMFFLSIIFKRTIVSLFGYGFIIVFTIAGLYTEWMFSANFSSMGLMMLVFLSLTIIILSLDYLEERKTKYLES